MRDYEIVYIFDTTLSEEQVSSRLEAFHKLLTDQGAEITAVDQWGRRQLAYPIDRKPAGYYVVVQFTADPEALPAFERALKLEDSLMRHLIVLNEGVPTAPMSVGRPRRRRPDDDEEDDDEEEDRGGDDEENE